MPTVCISVIWSGVPKVWSDWWPFMSLLSSLYSPWSVEICRYPHCIHVRSSILESAQCFLSRLSLSLFEHLQWDQRQKLSRSGPSYATNAFNLSRCTHWFYSNMPWHPRCDFLVSRSPGPGAACRLLKLPLHAPCMALPACSPCSFKARRRVEALQWKWLAIRFGSHLLLFCGSPMSVFGISPWSPDFRDPLVLTHALNIVLSPALRSASNYLLTPGAEKCVKQM